jgi:hypothetical protein
MWPISCHLAVKVPRHEVPKRELKTELLQITGNERNLIVRLRERPTFSL